MTRSLCSICLHSFEEDELQLQNGQSVCEHCSHTVVTSEQKQAEQEVDHESSSSTMAPPQIQRTTQELYYKSSGGITGLGLVMMVLFGGVAAYATPIAYTYAVYWSPIIYLNAMLCILCGAAIGYVIHWGALWGKIRNPMIVFVIASTCGLFALYRSWVIHIDIMNIGTVTTPGEILKVIDAMAIEGQWTIMGAWTPKGGSLKFLWFLEAMSIAGSATFLPIGMLLSIPFCEDCDMWVDDVVTLPKLTVVLDPAAMHRSLEAGDVSPLQVLLRQDLYPRHYTKVDLLRCPQCKSKHFLTVTDIQIEADSDDKDEKRENVLIENLILDSQTYDWAKENIGRDNRF